MTESLKQVEKLFLQRQREAGQQLAAASQALQSDESRLGQLEAFAEEYSRRFEQSAAQGLSAGQLQDYRRFLANLGEAIRQQKQALQQSAGVAAQTRKNWVSQRGEVRALEQVLDRRQQERQRDQARREQALQDEQVARRT